MSVANSSKKTAVTDWHRADVVAAIRKAGWSLRKLSVQSGLSPFTLKSALDRPYLKAERIIANAIGLSAEEIWPERYAKRNFTPVLTPATSTSDRSAVQAAA